MPVLTITRGLPGCGKSYWASQEVKRSKAKTVIVNRDDIRDTMSGGDLMNYKHNKQDEKYVQTVQCTSSETAVAKGWNIIVSDTNLSPKTYLFWKEFAKENKYKFVVKDFFVEFKKGKNYIDEYFAIKDFVEHCKKQNVKRLHSVREHVIDRMADDYYYSTITAPLPLNREDGYLECIIVDIDGTVAEKGDRNPYDETKVLEDQPIWEVIEVIRGMKTLDPLLHVYFVSGRHDTCYDDTLQWLNDHNIPHDDLFMRAEDDNRGDDVVKYELYMKHIHMEGIRVNFVLDDRDRVVSMWRKLLKLKVLQCAYGNF